jgi:hypothetical protein
MVALNRNWPLSPAASNFNLVIDPLSDRVRRYFVRHPDIVPEDFLVDALERELTRREAMGTSPWPAERLPLTEEDILLHAWLHERLLALHRERHGLWPSVRRFFGSN